jgi:hypothetical protein
MRTVNAAPGECPKKSRNVEQIESMSDQTTPIAIVLLPSALTTTSSSPATLLVDLHAALKTIKGSSSARVSHLRGGRGAGQGVVTQYLRVGLTWANR